MADHVEVPYDKDRIKDAPDVDLDADGHLPPDQERQLYRYYDLDWDSSWERANQPGETGWADAGGRRERDRMGIGRDDAMTRSEEQLEIGTERHRTGQARLRTGSVAPVQLQRRRGNGVPGRAATRFSHNAKDEAGRHPRVRQAGKDDSSGFCGCVSRPVRARLRRRRRRRPQSRGWGSRPVSGRRSVGAMGRPARP